MSRQRSRLTLRAFESRAAPAVFTVMNANDAGPGSLRQAVIDSNNLAGMDSIVFDEAGVFATPQTITLTSGQLTISDTVTIAGPVAKTTIDANKASRIFTIDVPAKTGQAISISGLALSNAKVTGSNG